MHIPIYLILLFQKNENIQNNTLIKKPSGSPLGFKSFKSSMLFTHSENSAFKLWKPEPMVVSYTELIEMVFDNEEIKNELFEYLDTLKIKVIGGNIKLVKK